MPKSAPRNCPKKTKKSSPSTSSSARNRQSKDGIPPLCCHKSTGYAYVYIDGNKHYIGAKYGTEKAKRNYDRLIQEWLANGRSLPDPAEAFSITGLCSVYIQYADAYYRDAEGKHTSQFGNVKRALQKLLYLYGDLYVDDFTPKKLQTIMESWVRDGIRRNTVNANMGIIKRCFKWGVAQELVPATILHGLNAVSGLRAGRTEAKESEPVQPVSESAITAAKAHLGHTLRSMIELQLLTGARPGEIVNLKKSDIDTAEEVWMACLAKHKTAYHGKTRILYFGPKAQNLLKPFLVKAGVEDYLFSPKDSEKERYSFAEVHRRPNQKPNPRKTDRTLGDCYTTMSYRRAIERACNKAEIPTWSPNQLRHNAATNIRKQYGLDVAQVILGHSSADITQVYAEVDRIKAVKAISEVG